MFCLQHKKTLVVTTTPTKDPQNLQFFNTLALQGNFGIWLSKNALAGIIGAGSLGNAHPSGYVNRLI